MDEAGVRYAEIGRVYDIHGDSGTGIGVEAGGRVDLQ